MKLQIGMVVIAIFFVFGTFSSRAFAEEMNLSVTGNGDSSNNLVNETTTQNTQTTQTNTAQIQNNVTTNANTGNNTANDNSGDATITTGNVGETISVQNSGVNSNSTQNTACCSSSSESVSGNGSSSQNSISRNVNGSSTFNQSNTANLSNSVSSINNTGKNQANGNLGKVTIQTGSIISNQSVTNKNINNSFAKGSQGVEDNFAEISGNGSHSENTITVANIYGVEITIVNTANIFNNLFSDNNTGENHANGNLGGVNILTGDVILTQSVENTSINSSHVETNCCEKPKQDPITPIPVAPAVLGASSTSGTGGSDSKVLGASSNGSKLPATGTPWMFIVTAMGVMFILFGLYLRFSTGVAPPTLA